MASQPLATQRSKAVAASLKWTRRRDIPLTILAWIGVVAVVLWSAAHIVRSLLLLAIAALLAYALAPLVKLLERFIPRVLAMIIVYLIVLTGFTILFYFIINTAIKQSFELRFLLTPRGENQEIPLIETIKSFGITQAQIEASRQVLLSHLDTIAKDAIPILRSIFEGILDIVVVAVLSIYLLVDGSRATRWLRNNLPQRERVGFFLNTLQRIVGGYIRGQFALAVLIGVLVGVGMEIFRVPYAVLLGVLAFVLAFVPVLGTLISAVACILLALTKGWIIAVLVAAYFVIVHAIEGHIVGPRIVGQAVGLHPIISIFALVAGAELFGIWGALFASPLAGVLQALIKALWMEWRQTHPEQFQAEKHELTHEIEDILVEKPANPTT